ncbi:MAG: hypothetical protein QME96_06510 [Myxococcota bacterium]|nr:hypothetical protein [Myxococcota bacterium]
MVLEVTSRRTPITAFHLDADTAWGAAGKRPDGVLVAGVVPDGFVCFVELKGTVKPTEAQRPFSQLLAGVRHFAPEAALGGSRGHGDDHHDRWRGGDDRPAANGKPIRIAREHEIRAAVLVSRGGTRLPPRWHDVAGMRVFFAVVPRHGRWGRIEMTLEDLRAAVAGAPASARTDVER